MSFISSNTPFLALNSSWWPFYTSFAVFAIALNLVLWFHFNVPVSALILSVVLVVSIIFVWWRDVIRESLLGFHTAKLEVSLRLGILLFILSEVFFFFSHAAHLLLQSLPPIHCLF